MGNIFIKSTLTVLLFALFFNGLYVKADIVRPPMPLCKQDGKYVECPDFIPDYDKNDKRRYLNVQHYSVQSAPNKKNKKFKKAKKFKRNKYSSIFISPAYADIIIKPELPEIVQSAYADVPESDFTERTSHPEQPFQDKTKILLTAVLAVLILIAGVSIKRSSKGKDNDNTNC